MNDRTTDQLLTEIRDALDSVLARCVAGREHVDVVTLASAIEELDVRLSRGKPLPKAWEKRDV